MNLAYRYCRDRSRAEDWAQEAFLRAFRFLDRWREESAFSTWLFALATNVYRSEARRSRPPALPLAALPALSGGAAPDEEAHAAERDELVRRAVTALPARYRDVLVGFYFHERDLAEVARTLGLREGTVKARLHRGRALLARHLGRTLAQDAQTEAT